MELDYGWSNLDNNFILKVVQILSAEQSLINVCRPATAILKKLVEADPSSASGTNNPSSSRGASSPPPGSVYRYGFDVVFEQMRKERRLLETVVSRLGSADTTMALYRFVYALSKSRHEEEVSLWTQHDVDQLAHGTRKRSAVGRVHRRGRAPERPQSRHRECFVPFAAHIHIPMHLIVNRKS